MTTKDNQEIKPTPRARLLGVKKQTARPRLVNSQARPLEKAVRLVAETVAEKRAARDARAADVIEENRKEGQSALWLWLAERQARFPLFLAALEKRLADAAQGVPLRGVGPVRPNVKRAFPLSAYRAAHRAIDTNSRKLAKTVSMDSAPDIADVTAPETVGDADGNPNALLAIKAKADGIRAAICEQMANGNGNARRAGASWLSWITEQEANAGALLKGEALPFPMPRPVGFKIETSEEGAESLSIRDRKGRLVSNDGKGGVSGRREVKRPDSWALNNAALEKLRRLRLFLRGSVSLG